VAQKISQSHRNDPNWGQWSKGRIISEETREKLRQANLGKKHANAAKEKCRAYRHTPEAIEKIRLVSTGRKMTSSNKESLRLSRSKPIMIDGVRFESIREAGRQTNIDYRLIWSRIKSPTFPQYSYVPR
jgi:hypothetical protein